MKLKHFILGTMVSLLLVSNVFASFYIDPLSENDYLTGSFTDRKTYGMFFGVNDDRGQDYYGATGAFNIGMQFTYFGSTVFGTGKSGSDGNTNLTSSNIGASIANIANLVPNTFNNLDNFVFYITGHGYKDGSTNGVNIGTDSRGNIISITDSDLTKYLKLLPSEVDKVVIIDACHSGGFIDELKALNNISVLTAANNTSSRYTGGMVAYNEVGLSFFGEELREFFMDQRGYGFDFDDMVNYLKINLFYDKYAGMKAYELGAGDEITLTEDFFNIQTYQSPDSNPVPEPGTIALLGLGIAGLTVYGKRRKNTKA